MKRFLTLLTVMVLVLSLMATYAQASGVSYVGGAEKFFFTSGSKEYPTDLFSGFKNVMPGDTLTEQIVIKNDASNKVKIKVYLRSIGGQKGTEDFLSQMKLSVQQKDDSILFSAPADQSAQLKDWVYLGTVYSGGEITLDVSLEVPITMGNEFQNHTGYIDWQFKVEEFPVEESDPTPPHTGDSSNLLFYLGLMVFSLGAIVTILHIEKRKRTF